jgi:Fe-S oxidoreductase
MNILVVNPPNKPFTNRGIIAEPIDVLQIATIIQKEYKNTRVIDMDMDKMGNNINIYLKDDELNIVVFIYDYQIPLHTTNTIENIFEIIKNYDVEVKTIIVGKTPSYRYEYFLSNGIDVVVEGEAEERINSVIKNISNKKISNIKGLYLKDRYTGKYTDKVDYSLLPIPNRGLVDIDKYNDVRTIISSRGCNGCCNYCSTPFFFGKWRCKNSHSLGIELYYLVNEYKAKKVMILDDNFTVDTKRVEEFCEEIKIRKIKVKLGCLSSIKNYDYELFKKMYEVGFRWIHFGIESGSNRILKLMSKDMDIEYIKKVIKEVKEIGFRVRTSYILDYPTQTKYELISTINLIEELNTDEIRLHFLARRLGTPLYKEGEKNQYIHSSNSKILNNEENILIDELLIKLDKKGYKIIKKSVDWSKQHDNKLRKIVALTPVKYGVGWNE